jgi:CRP-like cAMP-binding protein
MKQGDPADELYFLEVGDASVYIEPENAEKVRIRTLKMGTVVGEVGFYLNGTRSASVIANTNGIVQALTREKFELMKEENPQLALQVNEMLTRIVAERLVRSNRTMVALTR